MQIVIYTNGLIGIDGKPSGWAVAQFDGATRVYRTDGFEMLPMPSIRYSLCCDNPPFGISGRSQFDADLIEALNA